MMKSPARSTVGWCAYLLGALLACGSTKMSHTGAAHDAKPEDCDFQVLTTLPKGEWEEIAIIDVNPGAYGHNLHTDIESFKDEIRPKVCEAGGDVALAAANGSGVWIKATVLKRKAAPPAAPVAAQSVAAPTSAAPANAAGCTYDAQCKGDRICENGVCVSPSTKTEDSGTGASPAAPVTEGATPASP